MTHFAGIFPILQTPFDDDGGMDLESLRSEIAFCLEAGVHGLVIPANASEFFTLSDSERMCLAEVLLGEDECPSSLAPAASPHRSQWN